MKSSVTDKIKIPDAFWEGLQRVGIPRADVIHHARLPVAVIRDGAPVSTEQFFALWRILVDISHDTSIGLRLATRLEGSVMPPSFLVACHAKNFRDALQRMARFKRLCLPEEVRIDEQEERCDIVLSWAYAKDQTTPPALIDATFASIIELGRNGTATPITPISVELARPESARATYEQYYGCRVRFGAEINRLSFHRADLNKPFVSYNSELLNILLPELDQRLEQQSHNATLAGQVWWVLRQRLTAGRPDIQSIAAELVMSERSLQRKLADAGLTFQGLLADTRHQIALEHLSNPTLSMMEVAYMLGYEDQNSFFRAFRTWENLTPLAWRNQHALQSKSAE